MGWGAPLGFSSGKSPFEKANTATMGEPGWYWTLRPRPTPEHPLRARLYTPTAHATFESPEHATAWTIRENHSDTIVFLAETYIEWCKQPTVESVGGGNDDLDGRKRG